MLEVNFKLERNLTFKGFETNPLGPILITLRKSYVGVFCGFGRISPGRRLRSINIHIDNLAARFHDVTGGMVVLEECVFNVLPVHRV